MSLRLLNPRLLRRHLREARWWLLDYVYASIGQTRAFLSRARPADFRSGVKAPIVIIPGVYESWQFMRPLIQILHNHGHPVHVVAKLGRNRRSLADAAATVSDYLERENLTDVIIVAHSKGGLIGKLLMTTDDPGRRVSAMAAISAPFGGSRYARYWVVPSIRAFAPANVALHDLGLDHRVNDRITSIYGVFDPHIPEGSELVGARNIQLRVGGHFRIIGDPGTVRAVLDAVTDAAMPAV
ncbi:MULTISPECIES: alpha/beta hydrolase [Cryobacterium]|uniref:Alpha/beta hydrolase n=1 Tax=Cryobacterium breve TaxID=1259258 RepID=A0ABY2IXX3_9MICO|nr:MULTISPECIES: alpha/beta hydrolase [Cryobacterium]TFC93598.1 alpha/beta hydrolase [Cryobacterium sp. TmT3-12]TFC95348.1 alpha/beta hydrolase [Cryobacterium breve]